MESQQSLSRLINRSLVFAALLVMGLWFLKTVAFMILFFLFAIVLAMAANAPVSWMEKKKISRKYGTLVVTAVVGAITVGLALIIVPILSKQISQLATNAPEYLANLSHHLLGTLDGVPELQDKVKSSALSGEKLLSSLPAVVGGMVGYSLTVVSSALLLLVFGSLVVFITAQPRPLISGLLIAIPEHYRNQTTRSLAKSTQMMQAWMLSNIVVGGTKAVLAGVYLTWMQVPGAFVWATFTFFAELIPRLGPYMMVVPPFLVALALNPVTALWVFVFFTVMNELSGVTLAPWVRGKQMNLHPAFLIFVMLTMAAAFGLAGALIATPLAGIMKCFYEEFYLNQRQADARIDTQVEEVISRNIENQDFTSPRSAQLPARGSSTTTRAPAT